MAFIIGSENELIYLKQSHLFGRLGNAVDTYLIDAAVSRIHFLLEYHAPDWYLVDYSRNGTWLNDERIKKGEQVVLSQGDKISIGNKHAISFDLADNSAPVDLLCRRDSNESPIVESLKLQADNHLPNTKNCQLRIKRNAQDWVLEHEHSKQVLHDGDWLTMNKESWQMVLTNIPDSTLELDDNPPTLEELTLHLHSSLDEETVFGRIVSHKAEVELPARSHHYLLLLLARQSVLDSKEKVDNTECGWVYMEELVRLLRGPETLINIQIHRARKQLESALECLFDGKDLIERRAGQIRLGFNRLVIHKGNEVESI